MQQLDIEYFFPLTEQITLDLDYSQCNAHQYWVRAKGIAGAHGPLSTGMFYKIADSTSTTAIISINSSQLNLDVDTIEFKLKKTPNLLRRIAYKVMGLKWKIK